MGAGVGSVLKNIISHAYHEVEYYRLLFDTHGIDGGKITTVEDLAQIPFVSRDELQKEEGRFLAKRYQKFPWNETLELRRTAGSAGHLMKVFWDHNDDARSKAFLENRRNAWYGIAPSARVCSFYGVRYIGNKLAPHEDQVLSRNGQHLAFSQARLTDEKLKDCLAVMDRFGVKWLYLRPSIAILLAEAVKRHRVPIPQSLQYIELTDELLQEEHRKFIQEVFQVELAYRYSIGEANAIAFECKHKTLHVLEDNVVVEVVKDGKPVIGEVGDICLTSLTNYAMPLLRFETGDVGVLAETACPCGEKTSVLQLIDGHSSKFVVSKTGQKMSSGVLNSIVEQTNEFMSRGIRQFRITQEAPDVFDVRLSLKPAYVNWQESIKEEFLANITEPGLLEATWNFTFTEEVIPDKSQKAYERLDVK